MTDRLRTSSLRAALCLMLLWNPVPKSGTAFAGTPFAKAAVPPFLSGAERALNEGRADAAAAQLQAALATDRGNGPAHLLLCRVWLSEGMLPEAASECQAALANGLENDSAAQDWAGRALGRQAERAGPITGLKLALEVHSAFEAAVRLNPNSEPATVDLGEYYTAAPAVVGGGTGKALGLADRLQSSLPEVAHRIRAMVAEKGKDLAAAEAEFQAEAAVGHRPGALIDLAAFYQRHGNHDKALQLAHETVSADRKLDATVVEAATVLDEEGQTGPAQQILRSYLAHGQLSDAQPAFRVHTMLGSTLAHAGDTAGARAEFGQALALAAQYVPAQKGLGAL